LDREAHGKAAAGRENIPRASDIKARKILNKVNNVLWLIAYLLFVIAVAQGPRAAIMIISSFFTVLITVQAILRGLAILHSLVCPKYMQQYTKHDRPLTFRHSTLNRRPSAQLAELEQKDETWPVYTVLVPLKNEAHMLPQIVRNLSGLDYPNSRLQILLITEEDDPATCRAAASHLAPPFESVIVPRGLSEDPPPAAGGPRTKPNALNIAMRRARGEIITIFDAEDAPDPAQLKAAVRAFRAHPHWAALQAPLDYYNAGETWLTSQFALEYAAQFHIWIPLMARLGLPFPLGGTSNHILRGPLEAIGGWDSHNVTEDADLSFRLAANRYDIGYITPPTTEEAVAKLKPWIAQRTRWMKGFLQSWLVHMDQPLAPGGMRGLKRQLTLQLTLGTVLLAGLLHTPICAGLVVWAGYHFLAEGHFGLPDIVYISMGLGYGSGICLGIAGALRTKKPQLLLSVCLMPVYWLLLFVPAWRAVSELSTRPYYWSKTEHGLSNMTPHPKAEKQNGISSSPALPSG
jgi:cellulose synthase/poly-beta-1,6-N-acetylglucosamine synthase-like glycosyltransferase